jgi:histidinol phosphatase-like PHP family hydrolase
MPTILRQDGFAICINTDDHEPPHVHVFKAGVEVKNRVGPACG